MEWFTEIWLEIITNSGFFFWLFFFTFEFSSKGSWVRLMVAEGFWEASHIDCNLDWEPQVFDYEDFEWEPRCFFVAFFKEFPFTTISGSNSSSNSPSASSLGSYSESDATAFCFLDWFGGGELALDDALFWQSDLLESWDSWIIPAFWAVVVTCEEQRVWPSDALLM